MLRQNWRVDWTSQPAGGVAGLAAPPREGEAGSSPGRRGRAVLPSSILVVGEVVVVTGEPYAQLDEGPRTEGLSLPG